LESGLHFVVPFFDKPREFTWTRTYIDSYGNIKMETTSDYRIDLRESMFNFVRQEVYTKDTILLDVDSLMYYRIVNAKDAIYEVDDLQNAIVNVAQTQLKEVFGSMTFQECMTSQDQINEYL
jgi:regulator of protease activity HflC (stomatin/prohibitin superfamily)